MHYYAFHPGDYLKDTAHLSNEEDLAYRRLLDFYHQSEAPIPVETQSVSRRLRVGCEVVNQVLSEFFELREDGWHQARCDAAIAEYRRVKDRNQKNGNLGGRPKKTQSVSSGLPVETQSKPSRNPNHKPITNNHKPITNGTESLTLPFDDPDFADAWSDWQQHRKEKKKPLTPTSTKLQLQTLKEMGLNRAIKAIDHSIEKGWTGIFEPNGDAPRTKPKNPGIVL